MKKRSSMLGILAQATDLPRELLPGMPLVELTGRERILVENHRGILEYGQERILIRVSFGMVDITGRCLRITRMGKDSLVAIGQITGLSLRGGEGI